MYFISQITHLASLAVCQLRSDGAKSGESRQSGASRGICRVVRVRGHNSRETFCVSDLLEKREDLFAVRLHTRRNMRRYISKHVDVYIHIQYPKVSLIYIFFIYNIK